MIKTFRVSSECGKKFLSLGKTSPHHLRTLDSGEAKGESSCPQLPVQKYKHSLTHILLKSASLAPAARGRSEETERKGEQEIDKQNV